MTKNILFIGMDVHKDSIEIAIADGSNTEVRRYGKIGGTHDAIRKTLRKLVSLGKRLACGAGNCKAKRRSWPVPHDALVSLHTNDEGQAFLHFVVHSAFLLEMIVCPEPKYLEVYRC